MTVIRNTEIAQRRTRKMKLRKLRARYGEAKSATEKEKIVEKAGRIAPWVTKDEFLAPLKAK